MNGMRVYSESFTIKTKGPLDIVDVTGKVRDIVRRSGIKNGLCHVFSPHSTGIIIMTEHERALLEDIRTVIERLIPSRGPYHHPVNPYAHLRSMLLPPDKTIPVMNGDLALGTWQALMYVETDVSPRIRTVIVTVIGE